MAVYHVDQIFRPDQYQILFPKRSSLIEYRDLDCSSYEDQWVRVNIGKKGYAKVISKLSDAFWAVQRVQTNEHYQVRPQQVTRIMCSTQQALFA